MNIHKATQLYEDWLRLHTALVDEDLELKHKEMAEGAFPFLRGTFYRWVQRWSKVCENLTGAPVVLAVGDLHIENFGTWRDREGRLVWGINDFDEAAYLPYTLDLTRLATSAYLASAEKHIGLDNVSASDAILAGYQEGLEARGKPFVLAEDHLWLRDIARACLKDPVTFWRKMDELTVVEASTVPVSAQVAVEGALSHMYGDQYAIRFMRRVAGVGSLGHPRYVAVVDYEGGRLAREVKALVPSAAVWASDGKGPIEIFYEAMLRRTVRCVDPFVTLHCKWLLRRLAPDCSRIELTALGAGKDEAKLLHAMGWETANVHLGDPAPILKDLARRKKGWLDQAAQAMAADVRNDWREWKS
ncbi:MAG: DUF2252 family protein [Capsulimonadaceae bacterium]|nr:DUF2252 family protein [Capsulimonadaceae bacterium]